MRGNEEGVGTKTQGQPEVNPLQDKAQGGSARGHDLGARSTGRGFLQGGLRHRAQDPGQAGHGPEGTKASDVHGLGSCQHTNTGPGDLHLELSPGIWLHLGGC